MSNTNDAPATAQLPPVDDVIVRAKAAYGAKNDTELAEKLNVSRSNVAGWRQRGSIPLYRLLQIAEGKDLSLDWLLFGYTRGVWLDEEILAAVIEMHTAWLMSSPRGEDESLHPHSLSTGVLTIYRSIIDRIMSADEEIRMIHDRDKMLESLRKQYAAERLRQERRNASPKK